MEKIGPGFIVPSACYTVPKRLIRHFSNLKKAPEIGDLVYGRVRYVGHTSSLENKQGRIHTASYGTRAVFVFGNRYAPDAFEGVVPEAFTQQADLLARSGIVGELKSKNDGIKDPTKVELLGYVVNENGESINSRQFSIVEPKRVKETQKKRSKLILVVGTAMNSGKSAAAAACCWGLTNAGHGVRAAKVTGTASLKDILHMQDAGAEHVADFSFLGYPSTYLLEKSDLLDIFDKIDRKFANNPSNYWVVELADGILQRETALLLESDLVQKRIHRLVFAASDALGAIGGSRVLKERFGLTPHALSGRCTASPLAIKELQDVVSLPVFNNLNWDLRQLCELLI